jgi:hypothetical protein
MTKPMRAFLLVWLARLLSSLFAVWAIYRFLLRPDWAVEIDLGETSVHTWRQFWLWESPHAPDGVVGDMRWGRSLLFLAGHLLVAASIWRAGIVWHPNKTQQPTGAPSGAGG